MLGCVCVRMTKAYFGPRVETVTKEMSQNLLLF